MRVYGLGCRVWDGTGAGRKRFVIIWVVLEIRVPLRVLLLRVPYYILDLKRDLNLWNYPYRIVMTINSKHVISSQIGGG